MVEAWYPADRRTPEDLLRYYAYHFDTVEVDSSFYALPSAENARKWVHRTPESFLFHVKAFGAMTGHRIRRERLPADMRTGVDGEGRADPETVRESFRRFRAGIEPLRAAGKLGAILMQFPPSFAAPDAGSWRRCMGWIRRAGELLEGMDIVVEFRHRSWYAEGVLRPTAKGLATWEMGLVTVDEPQVGPRSIPLAVVPTSATGYFRLHGRNEVNWNRRVSSAAERFRYLYEEGELRELIPPVQEMAAQTERTFVLFNNCYADYAPRNALQMRSLLGGGEG